MVGCVLFLDSRNNVLMTDRRPYLQTIDSTNTASIVYYNSQQPHAQQMDFKLDNIPAIQPDNCDIHFKVVSLTDAQKTILVQEPSYRQQSPADLTTRFGFVLPAEWQTPDPNSCMSHFRRYIISRVPPGANIAPGFNLFQAIINGGKYLYNTYTNPVRIHEPAPKLPLADNIMLSYDPVLTTLSFNPYLSRVTYHQAYPTSKILQRHAARTQLIFKTFESDITPVILRKVVASLIAGWKTLFSEEIPMANMRKNANFMETMTKLTILALFAVHGTGLDTYKQHAKMNRLLISFAKFWRIANTRPDLHLQINNVLKVTFWS